MLGVTFLDRSAVDIKEKKSKKDKKHKKKSKKKKEKEKDKKAERLAESQSDDSGSASDGSGTSGDEKHGADAEAQPAPAIQREDWMTKPMARSQPRAEDEEEKEKVAAEKKVEEPVLQAGLRVMKQGGGNPHTAASGAPPARPGGVGDGGLSWRLKALARAKEQAVASGQDIGSVVSERWGSLTELTGSLTEGRAANSRAHVHAARDRERAKGEGAGGGGQPAAPKAAHYLSDLRSEKKQMQRPQDEDSLRWRRGDRGGRDREGGDRRREGGDRDREGGDRPDRGRDGRDGRDSHRDGGDRDRDYPDRRRDDDRDRDRDRNRRDRDGGDADDRRRDAGDRDRDRGGDRRPPPVRMSSEQAAALQGVAGALNTFSSDGSFMDRFMHQQQKAGAGGGGQGRGREGGDDGDDRAPPQHQQQQRGRQQQQRQQRDANAAERMREEMRQLRHGMGGDGDGDEDAGEEDMGGPGAAFEEEVEVDLDDGGDRERQQARGAGPGPGSAAEAAADGGNRNVAALLRQRLGGGAGAAAGAPAGGNKSAAEMLRARLMGKAPPPRPSGGDAAADLPGDEAGGGGGQQQRRREVVQLPMVDAAGRAVKGAFGRDAAGADAPPGRPSNKRVQRYEGGQRERYFADDDAQDLDTLVKKTKYGDDAAANNVDATFAANVMRKARFKEKDLDVDDEYDHDAGLELYDARSKRGDAVKQAARERSRQISEHARMSRIEEGCQLCASNPRRPVHLVVSVATSAYLMLPPRGRLVPGHCYIVPSDHVPSLRLVDDNVWTEIKNFTKCLIQMHAARGQGVLFMETAMDLRSHKRHAMLEAIPMGQRELDKAPGYFRKALQEAESEWSQHHAKAVIETTAKKGLRESIPPNFPYMYVQFGYGSGYVHVIDDETKFDAQLGKQVVVGLLKLPPEEAHRRAKMESVSTQQQWMREFKSTWDAYDWTKQL